MFILNVDIILKRTSFYYFLIIMYNIKMNVEFETLDDIENQLKISEKIIDEEKERKILRKKELERIIDREENIKYEQNVFRKKCEDRDKEDAEIREEIYRERQTLSDRIKRT